MPPASARESSAQSPSRRRASAAQSVPVPEADQSSAEQRSRKRGHAESEAGSADGDWAQQLAMDPQLLKRRALSPITAPLDAELDRALKAEGLEQFLNPSEWPDGADADGATTSKRRQPAASGRQVAPASSSQPSARATGRRGGKAVQSNAASKGGKAVQPSAASSAQPARLQPPPPASGAAGPRGSATGATADASALSPATSSTSARATRRMPTTTTANSSALVPGGRKSGASGGPPAAGGPAGASLSGAVERMREHYATLEAQKRSRTIVSLPLPQQLGAAGAPKSKRRRS